MTIFLLNDDQMSNKVGVEHQPYIYNLYIESYVYIYICKKMTCSEFLQSEVTYSRCPTPSGSSEVPIHNAPASVSWWAKRQVNQRWGKGAKTAKKNVDLPIYHAIYEVILTPSCRMIHGARTPDPTGQFVWSTWTSNITFTVS